MKLKLTDSNEALKAELEQVHREKSNLVDKHARDLKLKEKEMTSRLGEVRCEKKKAAEAHAQDLESKDMQIATIRELHTREIEKIKRSAHSVCQEMPISTQGIKHGTYVLLHPHFPVNCDISK